MKVFKIVAILLISLTMDTWAQDAKKYSSKVDIIHKVGNERNLTRLDFFSPIYQTDKSLMFIDLRTWSDNEDASENNFGIGYRKIIDNSYILSLYGYYDKRESQNDNEFFQKTFGIEFLTEDYDFRFNYYHADQSIKNTPEVGFLTSPEVRNGVIFANPQSFEASLSGLDIEVGAKVPNFKDLSLFLSHFHFTNDIIDFNLDGYRVRAEYNIFNSKDRKHNVMIESEYSNDTARKDIAFFGMRYNYSFGDSKKLSNLEKRMTNKVVRDIDVISLSSLDIEDFSHKKPLSKLIQSKDKDDGVIKFVDLGAAEDGEGTFASPFNNLNQENFGEGDIIYVFTSSEIARGDQIIELKKQQKLISNFKGLNLGQLVYGTEMEGTDLSYAYKSTDKPKLKGVKASEIGGVVIRGFDIENDDPHGADGAGAGIYLKNPRGTSIISHNLINAKGSHGLYVSGANSELFNEDEPQPSFVSIKHNDIKNTTAESRHAIYIERGVFDEKIASNSSATYSISNNDIEVSSGLSGAVDEKALYFEMNGGRYTYFYKNTISGKGITVVGEGDTTFDMGINLPLNKFIFESESEEKHVSFDLNPDDENFKMLYVHKYYDLCDVSQGVENCGENPNEHKNLKLIKK